MRTTGQKVVGGVLALLLASPIAVAQLYESLRGTIESVDGQTLLVKSRNGTTSNVKLADDARVFTLNASYSPVSN
jgi:hypothetical protein